MAYGIQHTVYNIWCLVCKTWYVVNKDARNPWIRRANRVQQLVEKSREGPSKVRVPTKQATGIPLVLGPWLLGTPSSWVPHHVAY